jgi:LPXTG-site transpeptidase (sortase) family protein
MNFITSRLPRFFNKPSRQISIFIAIFLVAVFSPIYLALAIGTLNGSASISGEPLVGGDITFSISVTNLPNPPPGTYFNDRLYNVTGEIVLPQYVTLGGCAIPPSSVAAGPGAGETTITFDNIKNLEVNEVITISCTATLGPLIDLGNPFSIDYRWESNTLPDESGIWVYSPGPGAGNYSSITTQPQAFDLEKIPNPNTGEVQVNGAGAYAAGAGGTGVNWPYDYTLTLTNNPLNQSSSIPVVDIIPPGVAYLGNDAVVCNGGSAPTSVTPTRMLLADGSIQLVWDFPSINPSEVCTIGYDTAIPYRYRTGADTGLIVSGGPFTGTIIPTDVTHINTYEATGDYEHPVNGLTPSSDGTTSTPQDDIPAEVTSGYHSIAKGVSSGNVLQDQALTYTIDGWVSEYYDFTANAGTPYVITDTLPDGLDYCGTGPGVGPNGFYGDCASVSIPQFNGAPLVPVSVVQDANFNLIITWHMTDPSAVQAGDTWQLVYDSQVRDFYAIDPTEPVSGLDVRPNSAVASGEWNDRITVGRVGNDDTHASASVSLTSPQLDKQIFDPVSGAFVDGPVQIEIGETLTYRVAITFAEDLDMRNVIVDDFLPRGQRYIPNTADFTGSQDYPGTPQTAPGVGYTGTTYQAEQAEAFNGFFIDDCPTAGRYPGPADPFLTSLQFLGGLQDLVWRLCRVDNSDTGTNILWQVVFDSVVVDDPSIFEGYQIANFGNLSGTNSFGTTYSLRDNLDMTYIVPYLITRKSNNAPDPLDVLAGTFDYTISIENAQEGTAYDWTVHDAIPTGIRIPGGACTGFTTTAPGAFECVADAGAQAGTGGFVTIRPVAAGVHDPTRTFPGLTTYNFRFNAELAPDATPAESLTNTASVEYCTQATAQDLNVDGQTDRRCIGYLDPDTLIFDANDTPHSDEGTPPTFADFIDYTDNDDTASSGAETNGTDNSTVNIVEVGTDKGHIPPTHTPPQVTTGDFATIGEVYQVTLEVTIPGRTHLFVHPVQNYVEIIDTFTDEGAIFCDVASAITGCANPTITQPTALVVPNSATWWAANNLAPAVGSTVGFFFNEIDNSADTDYTFTITFTMQVTGTNDAGAPVFFPPTTTDAVDNSFVIRYFDDITPIANQYTTPPASDSINIDQPVITTDKEAVRIVSGGSDVCASAATCNGVTVQGGDTVYYQSLYTNSGESTAMDVSLIDQLPRYVIFNNDMVCTATDGTIGGVIATTPLTAPYSIELQMDTTPAGDWDIARGDNITCTYSVDVEIVVPAGTDLTNFTDADWSTIDGVPAVNDPPERVFDDTPDDGNGDDGIETVPVEVPTMGKIRTSPAPTGSPSTAPVRIGDVVEYQITIPLPIGETRNLVVTDTFAPGLILYTSGPAFTFVTNSTTLTATQTLVGSNDGIGAFSVNWGLRDPACTGTPPCIINDGMNNTAATITFRAVVTDVPLNIDGLIIDNTVSATYVDGNGITRTATDSGPFDDEEIVVIEPQITLVKAVAPTTADAGDTLTYTVTITNPATPTASDPDQPTAYDVTWEDNLDNRVQYVAGSMVCTLNGTATTAIVTGTDPISITNNASEDLNTWDLRPGSVDTLVCTYQALVLQVVPPADLLDNTADADWSSLDGAVTGAATDPNERDYDDSDRDSAVDSDGNGNPADDDDDGTADEDVAQVVVPTASIDKIVGPISDPNYQADNQYQPGELIPYQITIVLPEGTTEQLTISDTFNANLQFEAGSTTISSVPAGVSIATGPTVVGTTVTWVLNDIVNPGTAATANPPTTGYTITLGYRLRVRNTAANGAVYSNTVGARYDVNGDTIIDINDPPAITDTATTNIETPVVTITKTENDADNSVDAGDVVTYTVTLTNTRGTTGGIAYDVFFTENLDNDTDYVVGSMVCNYDPAPAGAPFTALIPLEFDNTPFDGTADGQAITLDTFRVSGGAAENSNPWFLNGGDRIICDYQVTINANVQAGDPSVLNSVTVTRDTANNDQAEEITTTSSPVTTTLTIPTPTLVKDADTTAAQYQADGTYQAGELVPYVVTITVPEGQVTDLNVTDTLPAGFSFGSTSSVTTSWAATLTPSSPTSGATGTVTWAFGNVSVPGTTTGPTTSYETITIRFLLRVTGTAVAGTATNTAAGNFDRPGTPNTPIPPGTAVLQVIAPTIDITKIENDADNLVDAGDVVTYTLTLTNTSANGATAYDAYMSENLDDDIDFVAPSMTCNLDPAGAGGPAPIAFQMDVAPFGSADAEAATLDTFRITGDVAEGSNGWDVAAGDALSCTYNVTMNATLQVGDPAVVNLINAQADTANGDQGANENTLTTPNRQTTLSVPSPTLTKDVDTTAAEYQADGAYQPGQLVPYVIAVTVPEGQVTDLNVTDALPAGFEFDSTTSVATSWAAVLTPTSPANGATGTVMWAFGNIAVPGTTTGPTTSYETITIRFLLRVMAATATGAATNTAAGNFDPPGTPNTLIPPDTAIVQVDRPAITVVKTENDVDNIVDAGDVVTYTVVITNTSATATAYDTFFTDNLDNDTDYVAPSMTCTHSVSGALTFEIDSTPFDGTPDVEAATLDNFRVAGDLTEGSNAWDLPPGQNITCTYQVVMNLSLGASDPAIANAVSGQFDSANGDVPREENYTGNSSTTLTSPPPTFVKTRASVNDNVQVGEIVSYRIVVTIPEGTTNGLIIQDTLPVGFEFVSYSVANGWGVPALPAFSTSPAASATGLITWTFATGVQNPGDNNIANNTITFDYNVRVTTAAPGTIPPIGNGDDTLNRAEVFYTPVGGSSTSIGVDDAAVDVIRPTLNVVKSATPGLVDAADVVTYTVAITNTSVNGATIYDVTFTDNPNDFMSVDVSTFVCNINGGANTNVEVSPNTDGADPFTIAESLDEDLNDWDLAPADVLTCTYNVIVDANVPATSTLTNIVTTNGTTANGDAVGEDDITDNDDAQVATFDPQIDKALDTADTVYAPGELVPYVVTIRVPEGAILDLQFTDTLPAGLRYDSMGAISGGFALVGGAPSLVSGPADGSAPATYRFDFVDPVIVPGIDNTGSIDYVNITVRYFARVTSTVDAATLTNTVSGTYDTGNGTNDAPIGTDTTTVTVEIPTQDTTKVITQIDPDGSGPLPPAAYTAGDTVEGGAIITYQVTLTNTDATAILYDVTLVENPPDLVSYNAGSTTCTLAGAPTTSVVGPDVANADPFTITNNPNENLNTWDLTPGQSLVCTYTVTVDTNVPAGLNLINLVTGNGSSANGDVANEVEIPDTATTTIPTSAPEILKSVADAIPSVVTIGQEIEYLIVMQLPIGVTTDMTITDTLEGDTTNTGIDLSIVSGTTTFTRGGVDVSAGVTEVVTTNVDGEQAITWDFTAPLTYDPAAATAPDNVETIEIRFTAIVEDIANNNDGDVLWNYVSATLSPDGGTTIVNVTEDDVTDNDVLLTVPALEVDKTHNDANGRVEPGQVVTYTVTVRNVGTGVAQNLIIEDLMPAGWTYVPNSSTLGLAAIGNPTIAGQALTWNLDTLVNPDPVLNGVGALVLTYQATAPNPLVGSPYTNLAEASGNDAMGNPIPEDNTDHVTGDTDPTDDAATTLTAAAVVQGVVWHDIDGDGVIDAGETGIGGVTVQLYDAGGTLIGTTTTSSTPITYGGVTYPVGTYLFTDLPPGNYTIIELQTGPILNWESTADADTPAGTGVVIPDDYNEIAVTGLTAGEVREDQDFGERYAGLIQGFVYLDPNGDGSNTVPPGGGDTGIQNVTISLYNSGGTLIATTTTDAAGYYQFPNLPDGTYSVIVDDTDTDITSIDPNIDFTPGAVNTVGGLVVDVAGGGIPEAHFPFRTPAALAITKTGYDLNGVPLLPGETVGWIVCVLNPDALAAPNVIITDTIDSEKLTFVAGSVQTGIVAACPTIAPPAGLTAQPATAPNTSDLLTISYGSVPAGQYAVLYFETVVTDPFTWSGGGWLSVLSLLVFGWLRKRYSTLSGVGAQRAAHRMVQSIMTLILVALLVGGLSLSSPARSQEEGTPEVTEAPAERTNEPIIIEATEESTPEVTETLAPTDEPTPEVTETLAPTDEPTQESTVEATPEITETLAPTEEVTEEATQEATAEVTVEATDEATPEATAEAEMLVALTGRVYDDTNASLTDDEGESGISGVTVTAHDENDTVVASTITDENGVYTLAGIPAGDYTIRVGTLPDGYINVLTLGEQGEQAPAPVSISTDEIDPDLMTDAGLYIIDGEHFAYVRDTDSDGTPDGVEGSGDRDGDGIANELDPFDPSGIFYVVNTGNIVINVDSALYADMDNNCTLDTSVDQLANTVQANPQTSTNGGYRYDIRSTDATDPSATGIPDDGSSRCFFLEITDFPVNVAFPSTLVPAQAGALTTGGAVVTSPIPPTLPVAPATHRFFLLFQIDQAQADIINNHVAFDAAIIDLNQSVSNEATASRDGLPPVSDDDTLVLNNTLACTMTPNGTTVLEPGQSYSFNHTLTNTGTQTDTYTITYSTAFPAWTQSLTPASGTVVTLAPGATQAITYNITVPAGTVDTTTNVTTITATSSTAPNPNCSATDVTTISAACVSGILYNDTNLNGLQDPGENGLGGVTLNVFDSTNTLVATLVTAGDGSYDLGGLPSGTYRIEIDEATLPAGTIFYVAPNAPEQTLTVVAGGTCAVGNFGLVIYDPAITKNGTPDQAEPGDTVVFTITVTNNSTANITGVIVRDPLPSYFDFLSASTSAGTFTFDSGTNTVIFDIGTMTPGEVATLVVRIIVNGSAPAPGTVTNRAVLSYNEGARQTASDNVTIPPPPPPPPGTDPTPTPGPSPTPIAVAFGSVPGTGVGGAVIPSQFPSQLPLTGSRPNGLAMLGVSFIVFAVVAVGLAALALVIFRNRIGAMGIAKPMAGFMLIMGIATLAGVATFGALWLASDLSAPKIAQETSDSPRPQPTAVSIINPSMLAGNAAIEAMMTDLSAPESSMIARSPLVSLASWNGQFTQPEIPASRIVIPALEIDTDLVEAPIKDDTWDVTIFTNEIAHLEGTAYLGTTGNAVVAGHITHQEGYGPFRHLDQLQEGDIILAYGDGVEYRYVVRSTHYIEPDDIEYALPMTGGKFLTLISCAAWDQATWAYTQRLIVRAELVSQ